MAFHEYFLDGSSFCDQNMDFDSLERELFDDHSFNILDQVDDDFLRMAVDDESASLVNESDITNLPNMTDLPERLVDRQVVTPEPNDDTQEDFHHFFFEMLQSEIDPMDEVQRPSSVEYTSDNVPPQSSIAFADPTLHTVGYAAPLSHSEQVTRPGPASLTQHDQHRESLPSSSPCPNRLQSQYQRATWKLAESIQRSHTTRMLIKNHGLVLDKSSLGIPISCIGNPKVEASGQSLFLLLSDCYHQ